MLSLQKKFLFIHIPKTGGNSIQSILHKYSEDEIVVNPQFQDGIDRFGVKNPTYNFTKHSPLIEYKQKLPAEIYASLFKFACIRNPWDMMISYYFSPHRKVQAWNRQEFIKLLHQTPTMAAFISLATLPQASPTTITQDIDFLMRLENINADFKEVCKHLDITAEDLPVRNKSTREHYSVYYDDELIQMVEKKFHLEISFGGYRFEKAS